MKIIIVDDDRTFLEKFSKNLTQENYEVSIAESAERGLQMISSNHYDIVFTDLMMPGMNGIELIQKARSSNVNTFFIVITGYGTIETAVDALKSGACDYILKPFKVADIKNKIREIQNELKSDD